MLYRFFRFLLRIFFFIFYRWKVIGRENVPETGAVVLCSNHISNFDPPIIGSAIKRKVHFLAKHELFKVPLLGPLIRHLGAFPVKRGLADKQAVVQSLKLLRENKVLLIFPEGTRSRTGKLGKAFPGAASFALKTGAKVVPVAIVGPYRLFSPVYVIFGPPVDLTEFNEGRLTGEISAAATEKIMSQIRDMLKPYE